jgi:glycosyltransferase involved in cell wall biosynthesis
VKIDLVMWTYNSASALERSLPSIERAIDPENICHRIAVDGGSRDDTRVILNKHGWFVKDAVTKGIPYQANEALGMADTEFVAAFEHDIILNPRWLERITRIIASDEKIGAVQGIRLYTGSKTMRAIDEWKYRANRLSVWEYSVDNTLLRTEAVKRAGGFSSEDMASADSILRKSMFRLGYRWIVDPTLISGHYRKDFFEEFRHQLKSLELARYYWWSSPQEGSIGKRIISTLGGNPVHVLNMTLQGRMLRIPIAYYSLRLQRGFFLNLQHGKKIVMPIAMDDWHLNKFQNSVVASLESVGRNGPCALCGTLTTWVYAVPPNWGNILPKLHRGIGRRFFACSNQHARMIAEKIFKNAFDYVTADA